ncbi:conserved hypothetical protein [Candidatus Terasakiella magnetica]|uniref:Uncharacterized protein n=1 Tax=Candidatus Terasakiella magnetica TaxID=1867952 RepID=A0A1C3RH83_9PROT|nr:hypothetical protein [Candidatus Terasakiella magnetica]SCA56562.1 conserved hypothetical protein [Candidatus Terasakiella magnetica]
MYKIGDMVVVSDKMQHDYQYEIVAPYGRSFDDGFDPFYSPALMLEMGVFEGKYLNDCRSEFPQDWFENAKLADIANPELNYFEIKSRQPLHEWKRKGWIINPDPRGWFQWFCRYYMGRRIPGVDAHQIKRWRAFKRHAAQVKANCECGDWTCRPRQRQALLQWSHNALV